MRILLCILLSAWLQHGDAQDHGKKIDSFMNALAASGQFSGAMIVTSNGKTVFEKSFGLADRTKGEKFRLNTPCYIGSLSKQFTGMGIAILQEKGKLRYDQSLRDFFPELPEPYQAVTLRNMLQHSSGLPVFNDVPDMTEQDVFRIVKDQPSLRCPPGSKFEYCNANYTLLGMIIEKISGKTLDAFLTEYVFVPAGMKHTYVDEPLHKRKRATGYYLFGDPYNYSTYIGGAASVVSTARDLYRWSQALDRERLVSAATFQEIFTPGPNQWTSRTYGKQGYGFGWFISDGIVQHDGGFAGFRSYIEKEKQGNHTIIFISNVRHELIGSIRQAIHQILHDQPYVFPKFSAANRIMSRANAIGMQQAIDEYKAIRQSNDSSRYELIEREVNSFGYYLIDKNRLPDAILLLRLNTELFPASGNAFDSLGEAYLKAGDHTNALASYRKAVALNPSNSDAKEIIKKLESQ